MKSTTALQAMPSQSAVMARGGDSDPFEEIKGFLLIEGALDSVPEIAYAASRLMWVEEVHRLQGPYDLIVSVRVPDQRALKEMVDSLSALDGMIVIRVAHCPKEMEVWS